MGNEAFEDHRFDHLKRVFSNGFPIAWLKSVHNAVTTVEPWGILIVVVSLFVTISEVSRNSHVREANLRVMALQSAQAARERDEVQHTDWPEADTGQISVLERGGPQSLDRLAANLRWYLLSIICCQIEQSSSSRS